MSNVCMIKVTIILIIRYFLHFVAHKLDYGKQSYYHGDDDDDHYGYGDDVGYDDDTSGHHGYNDDGGYSEEDTSSTQTDNDNNNDDDDDGNLPSVDKLTV